MIELCRRVLVVAAAHAALFLFVSCGDARTKEGMPGPQTGEVTPEQAAPVPEPEPEGSPFLATRGIEPVSVDWDDFRSVSAVVSEAPATAAEDTGWMLSIPFSGTGPEARGTVVFGSSSGQQLRFSLNLAPTEQTLFFPHGVIGFLPREISIDVEAPGRVDGIFLEPGVLDHDPHTEHPMPIPADPGVIMLYDQSAWRLDEFELFRLSFAPDVIIFDFADYAVQRRFFARLAFFVGVTGESGRIEEESYYEGRHVFNAHDYRPEDIAAFFRLAEEQGLALNREERLLKEIAQENGIVVPDNGSVRPGSGAILSIAREIPQYLKRRLLAHEIMHGLFYALQDFREGVFDVYRAMSPLEKQFWYDFLGNKGILDGRTGYDGYDVDNEYLLVNEILGHVMQLLPHEVEPYFLDVYLSRMEERFPDRRELYGRIRREEPEMFRNTRMDLERLLERFTGLRRGNISMVAKENR